MKKYSTHNIVRAILNTFVHYCEAIVCFAIWYLVIVCAFGDAFRASGDTNSGFVADWITPLYFSAISITTIGFGDFSPQTLLSKGAVILEVFYGIFLFVVVLQKAMASAGQTQGNGTDEG